MDFLWEDGDTIYPMEVKCSSSPHLNDLKGCKAIPLGKTTKLGGGLVLCTAESITDLGYGHRSFPISAL